MAEFYSRLVVPSANRPRQYLIGVLAAVLAVLTRLILDPLLGKEHELILPLFAVAATAWAGGFWPAVVALGIGMVGANYFITPPRGSLAIPELHDQLGFGLFVFLGLGTAVLGEAQLRARRTAERHLAEVQAKQDQLTGEIGHRATAEHALAVQAVRLAVAERRFRELAESLPHLVWSCQPDGQCDYTGPQWQAYSGATAADLLGAGWLATVHPDDRDRVAAAWDGATRSGGEYEAEFRVRRHDGEYRWFYSRAVSVRDDDGAVEKWFGTCTDIHDRRAAEADRSRFAAIIEATPDFVCTTDVNGRVLTVNPAGCRTLGIDVVKDLGGRHLTDFHPPDVAPILTGNAFADAAKSGIWTGETRLLGFGGREIPVSEAVIAHRDRDGRVEFFSTVARDISELQAATATTRQQAELLAVSQEPVLSWELDGRIITWNRGAERLYGYTREETVGRISHDLLDTRHPGPWEEVHSTLLETGQWVGELNHRTKDGRRVVVMSRHQVIVRSDGQRVVLEANHDVTDRKRAEDALAERVRMSALRADVSTALAAGGTADDVFRRCADHLVRHLGAAFARIWTLDETGRVLELRASAGMYTHTDGPHARVPVGEFKIGRIAASARPHLTNDVPHDPEVSDPEWAAREGMVAFAGFPLLADGVVTGVLALFSRSSLSAGVLADLEPVADTIALWIRRQKDAAALFESETRVRTLADNMSQFAWMTHPDGGIFWYNRRWYEYTGTTFDEMQGWGWKAVHHPDHVDRVVEKFAAHVRAGKTWEDTFPLRGKDGTYRWFLSRAVPIRDDRGNVTRWFGTNTDVTDLRELQDELTRSSERFRQLAESAPNVVWTATPDGEVDYYNARWYEYTGLSPADGHGQGWRAVVHPDDAAAGSREWRAAVADGSAHEIEQRLRRKDGEYRWHLVRGRAVRGPDGRVLQWVGTSTDIEDQRRYQESLEEQVQVRTAELSEVVGALRVEVETRRQAEERAENSALELARSNEELEQFAYVASHDLQEPLRKIQAFGDRLKTRYAAAISGQGDEYLDRVLSSAGRMRVLIDSLLTFSRVTTKARPFAPVDLNEVAAGVVDDLETLIHRTGGTVDVGTLPTIFADSLQMRQLLQNLIGNGLKFHRKETPPEVVVRAEVTAGGADAEPTCRLTVTDNGIGFDDKYTDRIFQVFQRLHGRGEYEGTGIGLAICKKIVERHGGEITAHSRPGDGATFVATLPARTDHPAHPNETES